jgi:hypothetical protein
LSLALRPPGRAGSIDVGRCAQLYDLSQRAVMSAIWK